MTTNEQLNNAFMGMPNPYNKGIFRNYLDLCCNPTPKSKVGNLAQYYTVSDFVRRNVNASKHPLIHQRFAPKPVPPISSASSSGSNSVKYYHSLDDIEEGVPVPSPSAAAPKADLTNVVHSDDSSV